MNYIIPSQYKDMQLLKPILMKRIGKPIGLYFQEGKGYMLKGKVTEVNHEGVVCRVESEDEFVTFEVRKTENVYDLYMILGYDGKMLLKEFTDLEEAKEYAEKIIDSMKHIS